MRLPLLGQRLLRPSISRKVFLILAIAATMLLLHAATSDEPLTRLIGPRVQQSNNRDDQSVTVEFERVVNRKESTFGRAKDDVAARLNVESVPNVEAVLRADAETIPGNANAVRASEDDVTAAIPGRGEGRYLTYLPHGDYFSQRQSLENAIVLAWMMGRTLVLPPAIVDTELAWAPRKQLSRQLSELTSKEAPGRRELCARDASYAWCKAEEFKRTTEDGHAPTHNVTFIPWNQLLDLDFAARNVHIMHRRSFDLAELYGLLGINDPNHDVFNVEEPNRYYTQVYESSSTPKQKSRQPYSVQVTTADLEHRDFKLVLFGSLDAPDRLVLSSDNAVTFRAQVAQTLAEIAQPAMRRAADEIVEQLGGPGRYVGVYMRGVDVTPIASKPWKGKGKRKPAQYPHDVLVFKETMDVALVNRIIKILDVHQQENVNVLEDGERVSSRSLLTPLAMTACTEPAHHINVFIVPWLLPPDDRRWFSHGAMTKLFEVYPCAFSLPDFYYLLVPFDEISDKGGIDRDGTSVDQILPEFLKRMIETNVLARSRRILYGVNSKVVSASKDGMDVVTVPADPIDAMSSVRNTLGLPVDSFSVTNLTPELPVTKDKKRKKSTRKKQGKKISRRSTRQ